MSSAVKGARRSLIGLAWIFVLVFGALGIGTAVGASKHAVDSDGNPVPYNKFVPGLALDLAGGRVVILEAVTTTGETIDPEDLKQAVEIIRKRVDASGTSEAEITTQGDKNIIVALPGTPTEEQLQALRQSAQLQFRPILYMESSLAGLISDPATVTPSAAPSAEPTTEPSASPAATPSPSASASAEGGEMHTLARAVGAAASPSASSSPSPSPEASPAPTATADPTATPSAEPSVPADTDGASSLSYITDAVYAEFQALDCTDPANLAGLRGNGDPDAAFVTCNQEGTYKYILGPVELAGTDISRAAAGPEYNQAGNATGRYEVILEMTSNGGNIFYEVTKRISQLESPRDRFGILLDGVIISDPGVERAIPGGSASITGNFTLATAQQLANQLKFGALPLTLKVQSEQVVTATQGSDDLRHGLIAGIIGLALVVVYSVFQYRALGLVTVGSLLIAGTLSLGTIALLSWGMGYRLSLAGVTGLIVAIGITADSFIVYFERVRDELREGRSLVSAVEHGWTRARRTILASDAVSFLAAVVLYALAVGGVRGFAFTLGLTTIIDLIVVMLFTHPLLALLARTKFFGDGHRLSGLDPRSLGRDSIYKGRGRVADGSAPAPVVEADAAPALTLAERKAAARAASAASTEKEI